MTKRDDLEKKVSFRIAKVFFILLALVVFGSTLAMWSVSIHKTYDTKNAYVTCTNEPFKRIDLTEDEKNSLSIHYGSYSSSDDGLDRIYKECKRTAPVVFSTKTAAQALAEIRAENRAAALATMDPGKAIRFAEIDQKLKEREEKKENPGYTIHGVEEGKNYNFGFWLLVILIEFGIFFALMRAGLYVFGGKEAMNQKNP